MDITTRLTQLDEMVREAKAMPLSSSVLVNRDEVLDLIVEMQESLPAEIEQARWIVKDRDDLLSKARAEAEGIVEQARAEQLTMARQQEVVVRAGEEAERLLDEAAEQARSMRREAEEYVDGKLAQFEVALRRTLEDSQASVRALAKTLDQVEVGREKLRTPGTAAAQEFGEPDQGSGEHVERPARGETPLYDEEQR
jgi:F0F1-type ATP synthase membrane subunit b/b'